MNRIVIAQELAKIAKTLIAVTHRIGGYSFHYLEREDAGDLIILAGKPGYVWYSLEGKESDAKSGPGVYHTDEHSTRLLSGVDPQEFKSVFGL